MRTRTRKVVLLAAVLVGMAGLTACGGSGVTSIRSGARPSTRDTVAVPIPASPTTSQPSSTSSITASPLPKTEWSWT
jgi:hypothetical protein